MPIGALSKTGLGVWLGEVNMRLDILVERRLRNKEAAVARRLVIIKTLEGLTDDTYILYELNAIARKILKPPNKASKLTKQQYLDKRNRQAAEQSRTKSKATSHCRRWCAAEDEQVLRSDAIDEQIALSLGRTIVAVKSRRATLLRKTPNV